jgi:hypothetical protein
MNDGSLIRLPHFPVLPERTLHVRGGSFYLASSFITVCYIPQ